MRTRTLFLVAAVVAALSCAVLSPLTTSAATPLTTSAATPLTTSAATPLRVLFDNTKAETAGNADWVISTSQPDPTVQNPSPTAESDWTGALSSWGVALQKTGNYSLKTLSSGPIAYGGSGALDLSKFDALVLPEPNVLFTAAEKTALMTFVRNGGGLFMISDHNMSDRNNDGADSVKVLNDLMTNNSVDSSDPFGFSIDVKDINTDNPNVVGASAAGDPIIAGPFGAATGTIIRDGTTATLKPADNANVRGEIFTTGSSAAGTTNAAFVTSTFGTGRVAFWGDSSPMDDGTGSSGNTLFDGWNDPAGTDAAIALNATQWLAGGGSGSGGGGGTGGGPPTERVTNGGFEGSGWTLGGSGAITTARPHAGTHSVALCSVNNCTASASQQVTIPAGATAGLTFWTYISTQETGTTVYDKLVVKAGSTTLATLSNASQKGAWFSTAASLSAFAGQTITLTVTATDGTKLPTSFWVDDVSVLA